MLVNGMSLWPPTDGACVAPDLNWSVMVKAGTRRDVGLKVNFQHHPSFYLIVERHNFQILILYIVNDCSCNLSMEIIPVEAYFWWTISAEFVTWSSIFAMVMEWKISAIYCISMVKKNVYFTFVGNLLFWLRVNYDNFDTGLVYFQDEIFHLVSWWPGVGWVPV